MVRWCTVPEIWFATDGWTDGRTEKRHYIGGAPPKKKTKFTGKLLPWSLFLRKVPGKVYLRKSNSKAQNLIENLQNFSKQLF